MASAGKTVAVTIASDGRSKGGDGDARPRLQLGTCISRYMVLEEVGAGAMGEVYSAYDPELDRRVAVKLLQRRSSRGSRALIREAQAMAKLTHPNVVAVHDVGTVDLPEREGVLFIAMEYVEGGTLRQWWREQPRSWSEIVEVFIEAGRGLAAAHGKKLVHRDFKPDNVLVGGDGRVKVTDFGLARSAWELAQLDESLESGVFESKLEPDTVEERSTGPGSTGGRGRKRSDSPAIESTGSLELLPESRWYGTPAYMAPEQFRGGIVDALTDQFSFCISLFEALYGVRPFAGTTAREIATRVCAGERVPGPEGVSVPRHLLEVIERGLATHRRDRFPDMDALLLALDPPRPERRRWPTMMAMGLVAATAVGVLLSRPATEDDGCSDADAEVATVWAPQRRRNLQEAIVATEVPGAVQTAERVIASLDDYAASLRTGMLDNCHERAGNSGLGEVFQRREQCLQRRLSALSARLEVFAELEPTQVPHLVGTIAKLPRVEACDDLEALAAASHEPPAAIAKDVASFEHRLERVATYLQSSAYDRARSTLDPVLVPILALEHDPLIARAQWLNGMIRAGQNDFEGAEQAQYQSYLAALAADDDAAAVAAAAALAQSAGKLNRPEDGWRWTEQGHALAKSIGPHESLLNLYTAECMLAYRTGDLDQAIDRAQAAVDLAGELYEPQGFEQGRAISNLAAILVSAHRYDEALEHHRQALGILELQLGPLHTVTLSTRLNYGLNLMKLDRANEAREVLEAGLRDLAARQQKTDGALEALLHNGLGELDARAGDWSEAARHFQVMYDDFTAIYGPDNGYTVNA
ncbi:MAG: serine/threonine protein kinase, partial [Myxococcales bacterium]|nr:serine/threonine protein kinase [Myxococcales bacterium]